jgi:hypothetical protein
LRGRDLALLELDELGSEERLSDAVPGAVLVPREGDGLLHVGTAGRGLAVEVDTHVLFGAELDLFLEKGSGLE